MLHPSKYVDSLEKIKATSEVLRKYPYSDETSFLNILSNYQVIWASTKGIVEVLSREDYWSPEMNLHIKMLLPLLRDMTNVSTATLIGEYTNLAENHKPSYRTLFENVMVALSVGLRHFVELGLFEIKNLTNDEAVFIQPKTNLTPQDPPTLH